MRLESGSNLTSIVVLGARRDLAQEHSGSRPGIDLDENDLWHWAYSYRGTMNDYVFGDGDAISRVREATAQPTYQSLPDLIPFGYLDSKGYPIVHDAQSKWVA